MNRAEFQRLAEVRLTDARVLLRRGRYSAAYYLAGYVIECALKACIARSTKRYDFPRQDAGRLYTHDYAELLRRADLVDELSNEKGIDRQFRTNWELAIAWKEASRYGKSTRQDAEDLLQAIADPNHGVLRWIRRYW